MKQYFCKYIPVEGEEKRKTGSTVSNEVGICLREEDGGYDYYQKVELSLCSRDVQIGDEFNNTEIPNKVYTADIIDEKFIECYKHDCCVPKQYCYKVIGSISPDAVWVTEGMEFDEDEVTVQQVGPFHDMDDVFNVDNKVWNHTKTYKYYIQIKCPTCKHFH